MAQNKGSARNQAQAHAKFIREEVISHLEITEEDLRDNVREYFRPTKTLFNQVQMQDMADNTAIDITMLYCGKTGGIIGERNSETIYDMLEFYGLDKAKELVKYIDCTAGILPIWLVTNPDNLDKLMIQDPCGYFIYAAAYAMQRINDNWAQDKGWKNQDARIKLQNEKIVGRKMLQNLPIETVMKANEIWRKGLALWVPRSVNWGSNSIVYFCSLQGIEYLTERIIKQIEHVLLNTEKIKLLKEDWRLIEELQKADGGKIHNIFLRQGGYKGETVDLAIHRIFYEHGLNNSAVNEIRHVPKAPEKVKYAGTIHKKPRQIKIETQVLKPKTSLLKLLKGD